jgi:hypothetical protein
VKCGQAVGDSGSDRDGGRCGHRDGLAYDSRNPSPSPVEVCKVFEVETLGLDFGLCLRSLVTGFRSLMGLQEVGFVKFRRTGFVAGWRRAVRAGRECPLIA